MPENNNNNNNNNNNKTNYRPISLMNINAKYSTKFQQTESHNILKRS